MKTKKKPSKTPTQPTWPYRLPTDPVIVSRILDEAERLANLGTLAAKKPNPVAADFCYRNAWAFSLVGVWLRAARDPRSELKPQPGITPRRHVIKVRIDTYTAYAYLLAVEVTKIGHDTVRADGVEIQMPGNIITITV